MQSVLFCEVIVPLAVKGTYTYRIPDELRNVLVPGMRVEVQFGKRKHYTGVVFSIHQEAPQAYAAKNLLAIVDEVAVVTTTQLQFWDWMSQYYCCYIGEVMMAALPSYFRPDSETQYMKYPDSEVDVLDLPDDEYLVASALDKNDFLTLNDIQTILQKKAVQKVVKSLIEKRVIVLKEFVDEKYRPRLQIFSRLQPKYFSDKQQLQDLFKSLEKRQKQSDLLLSYLAKCPQGEWILRSELLKHSGISAAVLRGMVEKNIFENDERSVSRISEENIHEHQLSLNEHQQVALDQIREQWKNKNVVLLRGVTASGKTHVYAELIRETLAKGQQVLYLVPEIALTTQLIRRLGEMLGKVGVYHSKYNPAERVETWKKVLTQEYNVVIGARSAMFLPFQNLGLIVVDEEHDASYKQTDPAPRYQARDSIIYLAHLVQAKVILGSATPSLESWVNVQAGRFGYAEMLHRHGEMSLPELNFIDMTTARKNKQVTGVVSDALHQAITQTLKKNKQVIIFQNRRGYSPYISCKDCSWTPECPHCDVYLTFHKFSEQLKCHYCGYTMKMPRECPSCHSTLLEMKGAGTERIEDDIQALFPQARILRLDYDTARNKYAHERIIEQFENGEADILVGTQMVTKGLDFKNVELVGVLNADSLLYYPDFRAIERAYQLLSQVSGRAGRSEELGKVMIQISNVQHKITSYLIDKGIEAFYKDEMNERQKFHYPPFVRMIHISVRDQNEKVVHEAAVFIANQLKNRITGDCLGPSIPAVSRLQGKYIREILIKMPRNAQQVLATKSIIEESRQLMYQYAIFNKVRLLIDVDP